jgi:predicted permease
MRGLLATVRRIWQRPTFALAATATLAVGIAAPTAIFAVLDATLLRPLPYTRAGELYTVRTRMTDGRFTSGLMANEEMDALRQRVPNILGSSLSISNLSTIDTPDASRQITAVGVSEGFWELFGVPMLAGRPFTAEDYLAQQQSRAVVLSAALWRSAYGADPKIINSTIRIGPASALVVGIASPDFAMPRDADLWFAFHSALSIGHTFDAYLRLPPGMGPDDVQPRLGPMWAALAQKYPDFERNRAFVFEPLLNAIVGDLRPVVLMAFAATSVLFLLAVVNVINLYLARAASRGREVAVRTALGATRGHLVRQLIGESLVIAASAALIGLPVAYAAVKTIVVIGGSALPRVAGMTVSPRVAGFAVLLMLAAAVVVGLAPLLTVARPNLAELTNEGGRSGGLGRRTHRLLGLMIIAEVMLAIALVAGAGRLLLSLTNRLAIDPGFATSGRLAVDVVLPGQTYRDAGKRAAWVQDANDALVAAGAQAIATTSTLPLRHEWDSTAFTDIVDHTVDPSHRPNGRMRTVSANFFQVMGMPILAGRSFTIDDRTGSAPVVVVNQAWVKKFIPDEDPLRQRITFGGQATIAIVGVVRDVSYTDLTKDAEPTVFAVDTQSQLLRRTIVVTAANGHPEQLTSAIRTALAHIDSHVPVETELVSHVVESALVWPKLGLLLMLTFGGAALVLASIGVFGVIAFVTTQRQNEMAVRLALGGSTRHVFGLVLTHAAKLAMTGAAVGVLLAWWMGRLMASYVYQVSAANPIVLAGSTMVVLLVAIGATLPSARRAANTNPARSLQR